jgi:hypothetical protein
MRHLQSTKTLTPGPNEDVERFDVVEENQDRFTASLSDTTSTTTTWRCDRTTGIEFGPRRCFRENGRAVTE